MGAQMTRNFKPVKQKHSISKVVATIAVPQKLLMPTDLFDKVVASKDFMQYPRKSQIKLINTNISKGSLSISKPEINGFQLESFDRNGATNQLFKVQNTANAAAISYEERNYNDWKSFKTALFYSLNALQKEYNFYLSGISLNYADEFHWLNEQVKIQPNEIFKTESELLNKRFLSSENSSLLLLTQGYRKDLEIEEKTEVSFHNKLKRITINHHFYIKLPEDQLFDQFDAVKLSEYFDIAHDENKIILKDVLRKEVQDLIGLK
jgi:hypothetical protein